MLKIIPNMKKLSLIFIPFLCAILIIGCSDSNDIAPSGDGSTGTAGSYARFLVIGDFLYTIDTERIKTFSLDNPAQPALIDNQEIGQQIESLFALGSKLFIGSGEALYLYELNADGIPESKGTYDYTIFQEGSCTNNYDPVVANQEFAYVTLSSTVSSISECGNETPVLVNELRIFDITDFNDPQLLAQYEMQNPKGVGLDGTTVFICDNEAGLKIYDVANPIEVEQIAHFPDFTAFDVIPLNGLLLVVGPDNLYQFDYSDLNNIVEVSRIPIVKA